MKLEVPAYWYPLGGSWGISGASTVVLGTEGSGQDRTKLKAVAEQQKQGTKVLGYISSDYGTQGLTGLITRVFNYVAWYGVDGIFVDTVASEASHAGHYSSLCAQIRRVYSDGKLPKPPVWGNPGTYPDQSVFAPFTTVEVFEGTFEEAQRVQVPKWAQKLSLTNPRGHNRNRFMWKMHDTPKTDLEAALALASASNAGNVYVTDGMEATGNPYSSLPSYWQQEVSAVTA